MANICVTHVTFMTKQGIPDLDEYLGEVAAATGELYTPDDMNRVAIETLFDFINTQLLDTSCKYDGVKSRFNDSGWLGNMAIGAGLCSKQDIRKFNDVVSVAGVIECIDEEIDNPGEGIYQFSLTQEDNWSPKIDIWRNIIDKLGFNEFIDVYYMASEPMEGLYQTNDANGVAFPEQLEFEFCLKGREQFKPTNEGYLGYMTHEFFGNDEQLKGYIINNITGEIPWCSTVDEYVGYIKDTIEGHPILESPYVRLDPDTGLPIEPRIDECIYFNRYEVVD